MIQEARQAIASLTWKQVATIAWSVIGVVLTCLGSIVAWQGSVVLARIDQLAEQTAANREILREQQQQLALIEATRYTAQDAVRDLREVRQALVDVSVARPKWIEEQFADIKQALAETRQEIREMRNGGGKH